MLLHPPRRDPGAHRIHSSWGRCHEDFENYVRTKNLARGGHPVLDYIRLYANSAHRDALDTLKSLKVELFDYDWGINDVHDPVATGKHAAKEDER